MLGSGFSLGNMVFTKNFLLLIIFGSLVPNVSRLLSTWTFELPSTLGLIKIGTVGFSVNFQLKSFVDPKPVEL